MFYEDGWRLASTHLKWVYSPYYKASMKRTTSQTKMKGPIKVAVDRLAMEFDLQESSIFVATQGIAACAGSVLKELFGSKLCVAATDFVLHALQIFPNVDHYYLPPQCEIIGESWDSMAASVWITGIPIAAEFAMRKDIAMLRNQFGLVKDVETVLITFGGDGLRAHKHLQVLEELLASKLALQFLVLAGRNARFAQRVRHRYCQGKYKERVKVYDYREDISDFYAVADILVGKAGGLTVSEALASGLPIGIVDMLPGQEEYNVRVISDSGVGRYNRSSTDLVRWIKSVLANRGSEFFTNKINNLARPHSSIQAANLIASLPE